MIILNLLIHEHGISSIYLGQKIRSIKFRSLVSVSLTWDVNYLLSFLIFCILSFVSYTSLTRGLSISLIFLRTNFGFICFSILFLFSLSLISVLIIVNFIIPAVSGYTVLFIFFLVSEDRHQHWLVTRFLADRIILLWILL